MDAIVETTDYIFGKNATGYCFITGLGSKSPMNIHHRPSGSDGIAQPVPGLLVGVPTDFCRIRLREQNMQVKNRQNVIRI